MLTHFLKSETSSNGLPDCGDSLDPLTFEQILEMDDDEDERDFSRSIVYDFFKQAEATFEKMDTSLYVETSFIWPSYSPSLSSRGLCLGLFLTIPLGLPLKVTTVSKWEPVSRRLRALLPDRYAR